MNQADQRPAANHMTTPRISGPAGPATFVRHSDRPLIDGIGRRSPHDLPCHANDPDLWFAESPVQLERAKALCATCPVQRGCLAGALRRCEPCGVWGGEILLHGQVIPFKRGRGRPRIHFPEAGDADLPRKYA